MARGGSGKRRHETARSASSDLDESNEDVWVQCDNPDCRKWRRLAPGTELDEENPWYCKYNPDGKRNTCQAPEESWNQEDFDNNNSDAENEEQHRSRKGAKDERSGDRQANLDEPASAKKKRQGEGQHRQSLGSAEKQKTERPRQKGAKNKAGGSRTSPAAGSRKERQTSHPERKKLNLRQWLTVEEEKRNLMDACIKLMTHTGFWSLDAGASTGTVDSILRQFDIPLWCWSGLASYAAAPTEVAAKALDIISAVVSTSGGVPLDEALQQCVLLVQLALVSAASLTKAALEREIGTSQGQARAPEVAARQQGAPPGAPARAPAPGVPSTSRSSKKVKPKAHREVQFVNPAPQASDMPAPVRSHNRPVPAATTMAAAPAHHLQGVQEQGAQQASSGIPRGVTYSLPAGPLLLHPAHQQGSQPTQVASLGPFKQEGTHKRQGPQPGAPVLSSKGNTPSVSSLQCPRPLPPVGPSVSTAEVPPCEASGVPSGGRGRNIAMGPPGQGRGLSAGAVSQAPPSVHLPPALGSFLQHYQGLSAEAWMALLMQQAQAQAQAGGRPSSGALQSGTSVQVEGIDKGLAGAPGSLQSVHGGGTMAGCGQLPPDRQGPGKRGLESGGLEGVGLPQLPHINAALSADLGPSARGGPQGVPLQIGPQITAWRGVIGQTFPQGSRALNGPQPQLAEMRAPASAPLVSSHQGVVAQQLPGGLLSSLGPRISQHFLIAPLNGQTSDPSITPKPPVPSHPPAPQHNFLIAGGLPPGWHPSLLSQFSSQTSNFQGSSSGQQATRREGPSQTPGLYRQAPPGSSGQ